MSVPTSPSPPKKTCCAPGRDAKESPTSRAVGESRDLTFQRSSQGSIDGMRLIPGGEFIMGTDGDYGFAADGEGPAHPVVVLPFHIDATCVTNEEFNAFVNATGHRTESEHFGWSFVFHGQLGSDQLAKSARASVL